MPPRRCALGLVDEVVRRRARAWRGRASSPPRSPSAAPVAVQIAKQLINAAEGEEAPAAVEALAGALAATTEDAREGVARVPREARSQVPRAVSDGIDRRARCRDCIALGKAHAAAARGCTSGRITAGEWRHGRESAC